VTDFKGYRQSPWCHVRQGLYLGKLGTPITTNVDFRYRAAPTLGLIEAHEAFGERLARQYLKLGIKRRSHGQAAFIQFFLAVALIEFAPHFLRKIFGSKSMRTC